MPPGKVHSHLPWGCDPAWSGGVTAGELWLLSITNPAARSLSAHPTQRPLPPFCTSLSKEWSGSNATVPGDITPSASMTNSTVDIESFTSWAMVPIQRPGWLEMNIYRNMSQSKSALQIQSRRNSTFYPHSLVLSMP